MFAIGFDGACTVRRGLQFVALAGLISLLTPFTVHAAPTTPATISSTSHFAKTYCGDPEEMEMLRLINAYREDNGLGDLVLSPTLGAAAQHHSDSMSNFNYFDSSHDLHFE